MKTMTEGRVWAMKRVNAAHARVSLQKKAMMARNEKGLHCGLLLACAKRNEKNNKHLNFSLEHSLRTLFL